EGNGQWIIDNGQRRKAHKATLPRCPLSIVHCPFPSPLSICRAAASHRLRRSFFVAVSPSQTYFALGLISHKKPSAIRQMEACMRPSDDLQLERVRECVADLAINGIDLIDDEEIREVVYDNLDYFQLMLGCDAEPAEVITLLRDETRGFGAQ